MKKVILVLMCLLPAVRCQARIITIEADGSGDYPTIQAAIDDANNGDIIELQPGTYTGTGNRDIDFKGKAITVKSENGPTNCIIDCQYYGRGFYFHRGETASSVLNGFTITNGYVEDCGAPEDGGAGICCYNSSPTIRNCIITGNHTELIPACLGFCYGGGINIRGSSNPTFTNCIISNNSIGEWGTGGGVYDDAGATFLNCTISGNSAIGITSNCGGIACSGGTIKNCIVWDNYNGQICGYSPTVAFSNIEGGYAGVGNINVNPYFTNTGNGDYHLKSQAGRWDTSQNEWVYDTNTSPCIDAGNPGCPLGDEPNDANNIRINMGAYGGTAEASKTPANWRNIADLTNDFSVDFKDLEVFVLYWPDEGECIPSDLNRNQTVNFNDFAIFAENWPWP